MADETIQGITIEGSNSLRYDNGPEVDSRLQDANYPNNTVTRKFFEDRLSLDAYYHNIRIGGRFLFFRPSVEDGLKDSLFADSRIDKRYLEATLAPLNLRAGTFSEIWGHGLALSSFENREIYYDSELDGARLELNAEPFFATVLRGATPRGRPGGPVQAAEITAARINPRFGGASLGLNYVVVDSGYYPETHIASLDWRFSHGPVSVYGERAWNRTLPTISSSNRGHATYAGGTLSLFGWSLMAEYKDYDYKTVTPFQNPALVYREIGPRLLLARSPHVLNASDEVGYQAELSGKAAPSTFVTTHFNLSSRHATRRDKHGNVSRVDYAAIPLPTLNQIDNPYWETFVGVEQELPAERKVTIELGANEEAFAVWEKRQWAWLTYTTPFRGSQQIEFESQTLLIQNHNQSVAHSVDQMFGIAWDNGKGVSLTVEDQFSNDADLKHREGDNWPSVEGAVVISGGKSRISLFYGRDRGGLRCSNGVCRQVQAFNGFRLSVETTL
jgi:hypothetical protein